MTSACQAGQRLILPQSFDAAKYSETSHYKVQTPNDQHVLLQKVQALTQEFKQFIEKHSHRGNRDDANAELVARYEKELEELQDKLDEAAKEIEGLREDKLCYQNRVDALERKVKDLERQLQRAQGNPSDDDQPGPSTAPSVAVVDQVGGIAGEQATDARPSCYCGTTGKPIDCSLCRDVVERIGGPSNLAEVVSTEKLADFINEKFKMATPMFKALDAFSTKYHQRNLDQQKFSAKIDEVRDEVNQLLELLKNRNLNRSTTKPVAWPRTVKEDVVRVLCCIFLHMRKQATSAPLS